MDLAEAKRALRAAARERRARAHESLGAEAGRRVRDRFLRALNLPAGAAVGGYWPFGSELDSGPLLTLLHERGHPCALPQVTGPDTPLVFRRWEPGARLVRGALGEPAPDPAAPVVRPTVLLVPLLAFDRRGYRVGYGGGHYDRTLAALRAAGPVLAVGLAYSAQEVPEVPHGERDEALDWVITERDAIRTE